MLLIRNLKKNYGGDSIFAGVSLEMKAGRSVAVTGSSGGGKTTLLSIIGLLQQPTSGLVQLDGRDVTSLSPDEQAAVRNRYYGFVFQRSRLVGSLTALENVLVPAWLNRSGRELEKRAHSLLCGLGLGHRLHHRPRELSLGQLRRVALARALLLEPPIVLADEPTNDLDPVLADEVSGRLFEAAKNGNVLMMITHDPAVAARADDVYELQDGKLRIKDLGRGLK